MPARNPIGSVNDFVVRFANVNGSGSASANELFACSVLVLPRSPPWPAGGSGYWVLRASLAGALSFGNDELQHFPMRVGTFRATS